MMIHTQLYDFMIVIIWLYIIVVLWLVPRDFWYCGSIKDAVSLKHGEAEAETEIEAERQLRKDVGQ